MSTTDILLIIWAAGFFVTLGFSLAVQDDNDPMPGIQMFAAALWPGTWLVVAGFALAQKISNRQ